MHICYWPHTVQKTPSTLVLWLITNAKCEKHTHELFKSHRKEVFPADFLIITIWHDQGSMLESCVSVWNLVSQRWFCGEFTQCPSLEPEDPFRHAAQDIPNFPPVGLQVKQAPAGALEGSCLQRALKCVSSMTLPLPRHGSEGKARGDRRCEKRRENLILSVLCLILCTLSASLLMSACLHYLTLLPREKWKAYWTNK